MVKDFTESEQRHISKIAKKFNLSPSESAVFKEVLSGKINLQIGEKLCIAEKTVKFHLGNIFNKTNCKRRSELAWLLNLTWPIELTLPSGHQPSNSQLS